MKLEDVFVSEETFAAKLQNEPPKSEMKLDNYYLFTKHKFNWIQKIMWKVCFGITVKDYKEIKEEVK